METQIQKSTSQPGIEKLNKIIETQKINKADIQEDIYEIGKNSVTSNALTVLITLSIVGVGIFFLGKKISQVIGKHIVPELRSYLSTQEKFIKAINSNSEDIKKNLIVIETDASEAHNKIITKLETIELDVKEIKIIIGNK
ncbi:MAG: hypothetical protein V7L02_03010 [Nostoc sp.]|uniref:hypothetical protein n=1 Tax=unclassified Nostoc TaxID=2593658 RepID=UPI001D499891|nr:hypothetical protein [Nostoc sp. JL34]MBN3882547.1 hypothetical protein [Nostoc sp. JL34]